VAVYSDLPLGSQRTYSMTDDLKSVSANPQKDSINIVIDDYPVLLAGMRESLARCDDIVVVAECIRICDLHFRTTAVIRHNRGHTRERLSVDTTASE
jgi:hypothetical protein